MIQFSDQINKSYFLFGSNTLFYFKTMTKITQIHTGKYDFFHAHFSDRPRILQHLRNRIAPTFPPRLRNRTKRAVVITSILHFQKRSGPVSKRKSIVEGIDFIDLRDMDHLFTFGAIQLIDIIEHPKFFSCTQNQIDPLHFSDFFRLQLSITPRHHISGLLIYSETLPTTLLP